MTDRAQQSYAPGHWFMQAIKAEGVWVSACRVLSPWGNSAIKSFLLKYCEFGWNALPAGWFGLGFLWLQERKWTFHEPNYNLFEGRIEAGHLRPDCDVNSKGAAALIKICFHFCGASVRSEPCQVFLSWTLAETGLHWMQSLLKCLF